MTGQSRSWATRGPRACCGSSGSCASASSPRWAWTDLGSTWSVAGSHAIAFARSRRIAAMTMIEVVRTGVSPWECDQMGHLNVRHYFGHAVRGFALLGLELGLPPSLMRERGLML